METPDPSNAEEMSYNFGATAREVDDEKFPMRPNLISHEQKKDKTIQALLDKGDTEIKVEQLEDAEVITLKGRIIVPKSLQQKL